MPAPALPNDLHAIVIDLDAIDARARALVAGHSAAALNWQPDGGAGWSVAQCLEHIALTNARYGDGMSEAVARRGPSRPRRAPIHPGNAFERWFIRLIEPPVRTKVKTRPFAQPPSRLDPHAALADLVDSHGRMRASLAAWAGYDLNHIRFPNPFAWNLALWSVATGLFVVGAHGRRHLAQADRVVAAPGFPAA